MVDLPPALHETFARPLRSLDLEPIQASRPEEIRDVLFDNQIAAALVHFGRDVPRGAAHARALRKHPAGRDLPLLALLHASSLAGFPLDCGVDELLILPVTAEEVFLRLRFVFWRTSGGEAEGVLKIGNVTIDVPGMHVRVKGVSVELTYKEFALLRYFVENDGLALPRTRILDAVWGEDYYGGDRTVDIHIRRLRAKLPELAHCIQTVHGVGYRFVASPETV
ncbi:MAG: response regulator transcription factor [Armatimonadetes bacterium]|nr:response regulator transcription factor [Armatimonadota bacterium]